MKGKMMNADNDINGNIVPVIHGELRLRKISKMPKGKVTHSKKEILAHSETGHHHILECDKPFDLVVTTDGKRAVMIKEVSKLWHNKTVDIHETKKIAPGVYEIVEKVEYNPFSKIMQRVFD
jgi:hypothetical protein